MNERKTENIVRKHFDKFANIIIEDIEEQKSDNPKIDKLLKNASKKGDGAGYPDFIITYKNNSDFVIVVECKPDITKHVSKTKDKYSTYAVDGVLLYASFLSKEFDVLAIAVSGENAQELKTSHFLLLKGTNKAIDLFSNKLLAPDVYFTGYTHSPEKFRQDYDSLREFSRELNQELHSHKILESQRSLLISGILIALENKAFRRSYKEYENADELTNALVNTISSELKKANIQPKKLENLDIQFSFIRTDATLSGQKNVLSKLIDDIDLNINKFIKTHEYFDVLGQLYIEFLRYANSDASLGIVLTPPHITELFCDLAKVNKNSIVYDNCAGTGGFLISAMSKMVKDAKGDEQKEVEIKEKQIIGVEYQSHIFALACSNMFIHRDGKTNIFHGSCFDGEIIKQIRKYNPTVGLLNPPYQTDKKDIPELEFILNNLDVLIEGGICVAIIPIERVLAISGRKYELKKKLLELHTLEAVMSMPDQLFHNSDTGSVTVAIVITAHKPHPKNKETYFGYWKDDGYVKRKTKGRIDAYQKWDNIKFEWLDSYINRKNKPGFSINRIVTADDEWCAEAYMETDYSKITSEDFIRDIKKYVVFKKTNVD